MKIARIAADGEPRAIGRALGEASRRAVRELLPRIGRFRELHAAWAGSERVGALESRARAAFPDYVAEIEGMAEGAGVDFATLFLWNCRGDLPGGGDQTPGAASGCTTVMAPANAGRPALIAHNEDDQAELDGHCLLADVTPDRGPPFTSFYSPGLLPGHTFAVNGCGLVQTINHVRPADQAPGVPRHFVCRAVLACRDIDTALALLRRGDRAAGFHHNLGQAGSGRLVSVEAPSSGCVAREIEQPSAHANHLVYPPFDAAPQVIADSSASRQARAEALLAAGLLEDDGPLAILGDSGAGDGGWPIRRRDPDGPDAGYTLATALFTLHEWGVEWGVYADTLERPVHAGRVHIGHAEPIPVM